MAGAFIEVRIEFEAVLNLLKKVANNARSSPAAWRIVGDEVVKSVRQNFMAGGRPEKWTPLSAATLFGVAGGRKGLTRKGTLRKSAQRRLAGKRILIGQGMRGGLMGSIHYTARADGVRIGTDKVYAAIHQFGGPAGRRSARVIIPARPFLLIQDQDWPKIKQVLEDYLFQK